MPDYLFGMAMTDADGGIYISSYGPANLDLGDLTLEADTHYPFRDTVTFTVHGSSANKPVNLRIPSWCAAAEVTVNGVAVEGDKKPGTYFRAGNTWNDGDVIVLRLPMNVTVRRLNDGDSWGHFPLVVEYGPLVFSLPIPEVWKPIAGHPHTPLPEGWSWYDVEPDLINDPGGDVYEQIVLRKHNIGWNVAIGENLDLSSVEITEHEGGYVWENPPLTIKLPGYKALFAYAPYVRKTQEVYQAPIDVHGELTLTLVPYGCTCLRITCFPRANV